MEAHYAGAVPIDLLGQEQERIAKALQKIASQLAATSLEFDAVERNLQLALDLTVDCGAAYQDAPEDIKRMFNQAFFEKVLIIQDDESIGDIRLEAEFREPFDTLLGSELKTAEAAFKRAHKARSRTSRSGKEVAESTSAVFFRSIVSVTDFWWRYGDSNPGPLACHASALPAELYPQRSNDSNTRLHCQILA